MSEIHKWSADYFDVRVNLDDEDHATIELKPMEGTRLVMDWDDFREVIEFVCKHGLGMENPWVGEYAETKESAGVSGESDG